VDFEEDDSFMEERQEPIKDKTVQKVWDVYEKIKDTQESHEINTKKTNFVSF
jgi:hypothetical protein